MRNWGLAVGRIARIVVIGVVGLVAIAGAGAAQQSRVFVTSTTQDGDLGGLDGADMLCEELAGGAGLGGGPWVAWLSTDSVDAVDRLLPGSGPFVRAADTATVIADDIADLTDGSIANPILLDENGVGSMSLIWTSTLSTGLGAGPNCAGWQSNSPNDGGGGGDPTASDPGWTSFLGNNCDLPQGVYCFEAPVPMMPTLPRGGAIVLAALLLAAGAGMVYRRNHAVR